MNRAIVGDEIAIVLQIVDGATDQYPQAIISDNEGNILTTLDLVHETNGLYVTASPYTMPDKPYIKVVYIVWSDASHTTESSIYLRDLDIFVRDDIGADWRNNGRLDQIIDSVKTQTDKMNFNGDNIQARVADKGVLNNPPSESINDYKADVSTLALQSTVTQYDNYKADVSGIPTNPLLTNDSRLDNLDAPISSRSSHADPTSNIKGIGNKDLTQVFNNERGTDGAYTGTPPTVEEIRAELEKAGTKLTDLHDEAFGKWVLDPTAKTLTLYKSDGTTILKTFALTNATSTVPAFIERIPQ